MLMLPSIIFDESLQPNARLELYSYNALYLPTISLDNCEANIFMCIKLLMLLLRRMLWCAAVLDFLNDQRRFEFGQVSYIAAAVCQQEQDRDDL